MTISKYCYILLKRAEFICSCSYLFLQEINKVCVKLCLMGSYNNVRAHF